MATVNLVFGRAAAYGSFGILSCFTAHPRASENIISGATSAQSTGTALYDEVVRVTAMGGPVYVAVGPNPAAAAGKTFLVPDNATLDLGGLQAGDKIAVINA